MAELFELNENIEEITYNDQNIDDNKKIVATKLNVRENPSTSARIVEVLPVGAEVQVIQNIDNEWSKLGENKFVMTQYLK